MGFATNILTGHESSINRFRALLARRLNGPDLLRAVTIAEAAMVELGGGPQRVEQRLKSTLAWCRSQHCEGLTFDANAAQVAAAFHRTMISKHKTAYAHALGHARTVQAVSNELQVRPDRRRALVNQALRLSTRARDFALSAMSARANARRDPFDENDQWTRDFARADRRKHKQKSDELIKSVMRLEQLLASGWIVRVYTICLPAGYHPSSEAYFGLADSPDADEAAQALRAIVADAMPSRGATARLAGVRRIELHASGTPHCNLVMGFRSHEDATRFETRLKAAYLSRTYHKWNVRVVAGFRRILWFENPFPSDGFPAPPPRGLPHEFVPIVCDTVRDSEHLGQCVQYQLKDLCSAGPCLASGRVVERLGALRLPHLPALNSSAGDNRTKTDQEADVRSLAQPNQLPNACRPRGTSRPTCAAERRVACGVLLTAVEPLQSRRPRVTSRPTWTRRLMIPQPRAPPLSTHVFLLRNR